MPGPNSQVADLILQLLMKGKSGGLPMQASPELTQYLAHAQAGSAPPQQRGLPSADVLPGPGSGMADIRSPDFLQEFSQTELRGPDAVDPEVLATLPGQRRPGQSMADYLREGAESDYTAGRGLSHGITPEDLMSDIRRIRPTDDAIRSLEESEAKYGSDGPPRVMEEGGAEEQAAIDLQAEQMGLRDYIDSIPPGVETGPARGITPEDLMSGKRLPVDAFRHAGGDGTEDQLFIWAMKDGKRIKLDGPFTDDFTAARELKAMRDAGLNLEVEIGPDFG